MKSRKLRTVLIVIAAMIFAYAVVLFVLTQVQTSKMDDHFARAEKQVFSLDAEKITYIAVQNGNGELYEFTGGEKAAAIDITCGSKDVHFSAGLEQGSQRH